MPEKKKIAVIDDEETLCGLIKLNLESTGRFEVMTASDPREGIKMVRSFRPDMILLDLMMPYMEGSEVAEKFMEFPETKDIPIVFLTALAERSRVEANAGNIAGREFLAKPITTSELVRKIDMVLGYSGK